ncbi:ATP-binding protein [Pseudoalteromonas sp. SMS1]|uniref:ATP-binding protein n=1 Tax=Pseudoalteromonas sp. SMS1 TaxID=2908894 RepID=UPI001F3E3F0B|nr:ATP-binding protein [Pseudoalteromonas sp. SMS1]MCF2858583.1 ATP-binding protein [Pseudoalteromonas sp. SMS1]
MALINKCWIVIFTLGLSIFSYASEQHSEVQSLAQQIQNIAQLKSWQEQQMVGEQLLNHPKLSQHQSITLLQTLGKSAFQNGELRKGVHFFKRMEVALGDTPDLDRLFMAIKMQGIGWYHSGEFAASERDYTRALVLAKNHQPPIEVAHIQNNLGLAYVKMHDLMSALSHYLDAYELYKLHGNEQDQADIILNIAGVYIRLLRYEKAEELLQKAITLFEQLGDSYGIALSQANLGVLYTQTSRFEEAATYLQNAIDYYEAVNDVKHLSYEYSNLAKVSISTGDMAMAETYVNFAIYYAEKAENDSNMSEALYVQAQVFLVKGQIAQAQDAAQRSLEMNQSLGAELREKRALSIIALTQAAQSNTAEALQTLTDYDQAMFKLLNQALLEKAEKYQKRFEESELSQELAQLKQAQQLQELKSKQQQQLMWMSGLVVGFALLALVAWYRRTIERKAKLDLSNEVAERTAELQKTADQLRHANQIKSQFLANISHEIRTPLTAILGYSENMLHEHHDNERLKESLTVLMRQGRHLKELISDVLDLSKIEAEQLELELTEFKVESLLSDVTDMFHHPCLEKSLELIVEHRLETPYRVCLDYVRVKQVLINLLSNAIKFTHHGQVELLAESQDDGILFSVTDTGIGMSAAQLEKIFEHFQQGDNSITRRFGGSGLGLSLSQQLAAMMGGVIKVTSEPHVGSRFSFWVPCTPLLDQREDIGPLIQPSSSPRAMFDGQVLLAEDHDDNRVLFERILCQLGVQVESALDGKQAVEKCLSSYPDLVLMDIQMPHMDGLEALRLLRQAGYEGPIYALTANVMEHEIKYYLDNGFDGHLSKPLEQDKLITVLQSTLGKGYQAAVDEEMSLDMTDLKLSFASTLEQERYKLIDLWQEEDYSGLQYHCHKLAGAAAVFGFFPIADIAKQFEAALKAHNTDQYQDLFLILCDELKVQACSEQFDIS